MERNLTSRRPRSWLQDGLGPSGLSSMLLVALLAGCSGSSSSVVSGAGGGNAGSAGDTGGSSGETGGVVGNVGGAATGGSVGSGGASPATGGSTPTGGNGPAGGATATGGIMSTGGAIPTGGNATGGLNSTGGATSTGGTVGMGGTRSTGGTVATAGTTSKGGNSATGGSPQTGGATGTAGSTSVCGATGATYDSSAVATTCPAAVPGGITSSFCSCVNEGPSSKVGGGFSVANNVWGSGPGPECVWATTSTLWGVTANHPQTSGVKSYPNIGYSPRLLISSIKTYTSSFDITPPGSVGAYEAAYDIWLRTPGGGNTRIELMIWMYTYKTGPISSIVATTKPTIGNYTWTVHYGSNGSNATISLVNTSPSGGTANVTSGTVDVKGILDWLIANNTTQYGQFDNTWTLDQVQWGFEISGDGGSTQEFINNCFSVSST